MIPQADTQVYKSSELRLDWRFMECFPGGYIFLTTFIEYSDAINAG